MSAPLVETWLIEDHTAFRRAIARTLRQTPDLTCTGEYATAEEALAASGEPRLILLDVGLPGMSGLEAMPRLRARWPAAAIIVLTVFEDDEKIFRAICAGAAGYLLKASRAEEITAALREALAGGAPMNGRIARRVLEMFARLAPPQTDYRLSVRERGILEAMVQGKTKKEIAAACSLSYHTVDSHLRHIYTKLEVNTRTGAVAKALREKLV